MGAVLKDFLLAIVYIGYRMFVDDSCFLAMDGENHSNALLTQSIL